MEIITITLAIVSVMMYFANKSLTSERDFYKTECVRRMRYKNEVAAENELVRLYEFRKKNKDK